MFEVESQASSGRVEKAGPHAVIGAFLCYIKLKLKNQCRINDIDCAACDNGLMSWSGWTVVRSVSEGTHPKARIHGKNV